MPPRERDRVPPLAGSASRSPKPPLVAYTAARYWNEKRWWVGSKVQGYPGPGRVTQK